MTPVFFNLLVNSTLSLFAGYVVVMLAIWFFRVEVGAWKIFLLSLPFVKIVYDCVRGIPTNSVLLSGVDPFSLPPKHQFLKIGAGFNSLAPVFSTTFSVQDAAGNELPASVGDYLTLWLTKKFGGSFMLVTVSVVLGVALALVCTRLAAAIRFEIRRRVDRRQGQSLRVLDIWWRGVDVYSSNKFSGTPFTGGILYPYICIPSDTLALLSKVELEAVILHELSHIRQLDVLTTIFIQILGDVFWFVPGYRRLSRSIDRLREIVADQHAVKFGASPVHLASALLKIKEIPETPDYFVLYSAFVRAKSLLRIRVERLINSIQDPKPRFGWQKSWFRWGMSIWIFMAVIFVTIGGNHHPENDLSAEQLDHFLRFLEFI